MKYRILLLVLITFNIQLSQAQVGIGTTDPTSSLTVEGSFSTNTEILALSTTLDDTHHTVIGNNITITLPSPNSIVGREYIIKAGNTGNVIVAPSGTDVIDGANSSITLDTYKILKVQSIGAANWIIVNESSNGSGGGDGDAWGVTGEDQVSNIYRSGDVGIGTSGTPNSTIQVEGSMSLAINTGTTDYTLTDDDYTYITNNGTTNAADVTLPSAVGREGRIYIIKYIGYTFFSSQRVIPFLGETIDGATSQTLGGFVFPIYTIKVQSDGANWWIINEF